jgi:4-amino-4-deoxy-L-arabinose transferase-like glycosyltransferase
MSTTRGLKENQKFQITDNGESSASTIQNQFGIGERGWLWLASLICLAIVFSNLGSSPLFEPDEGRNAEKAREILLLADWVTPHEDFLPTLDKPIFFYWLVAISFRLFGLSEWSARLPSALAGLGCVFLVYRFARLQWGLQEGLWSSLVLITSFEFFLFSQIVILDMTLTLFISLALCSFYAVTQTDNPRAEKRYCLLMYTGLGAGTLAKGPIALVLTGMIIFFYLLFTRRWFLLRRLHIPLGALVYFAVVAPWYLWVEARNPGYLRYFLWEEHFVRYLTPHFSRTKTWYYFFLVLAVGFLPWSFFIPVAAKNLWNRTFTDANLFLILWVILPFAFFSASNAKLPHYILPIYPPLAILTGQAVAGKMRDPETQRSAIPYNVGIFIVAFIVYLLAGASWPNLLASDIRSEVPQSVSLLLFYGTIITLIFGVFVAGDLKNVWKGQGAAFMCTAVCLALFFLLAGKIVARASFRRAPKAMAQTTAALIDRPDRLVFYDTYIEGLPFYLRIDKPIWLVQPREKGNIMGSFYVAEKRPAPAPSYGQVLFTFEEFADRWKANELPLRVFLKEKNLLRFSKQVGVVPKKLMRFDDFILVSNR